LPIIVDQVRYSDASSTKAKAQFSWHGKLYWSLLRFFEIGTTDCKYVISMLGDTSCHSSQVQGGFTDNFDLATCSLPGQNFLSLNVLEFPCSDCPPLA
jgi:hypothetical protein